MTELYQHRTKESMLMMVMVWLVDTHSHLCVYYTEFSGHTHKIQQQKKNRTEYVIIRRHYTASWAKCCVPVLWVTNGTPNV